MPASTQARARIESALLDFHRHPARHLVALRQPAVLFDALNDVLHLAAARPAGALGEAPREEVVAAACFFVQAALLQPGANHYALLGLDRNAPAKAVKDRYRQLMRLLHPDHAGRDGAPAWAPGEAARINQAYEVLCDSSKRKAYDLSLSQPAPGAAQPAAGRGPVRIGPKPPPIDLRMALPRLAAAFGAAGCLAMLGAWLASGQPDKETLVQRHAPATLASLTRASTAMPPTHPTPSAESPGTPTPPETFLAMPLGPEPGPQRAQGDLARTGAVGAAPARAMPSAALRDADPSAAASVPVPTQPPGQLPARIADAPASAPPASAGIDPPQYPAGAAGIPTPPTRTAPVTPKPSRSPTMGDVHQQLTTLVQHVESGWGDRVVGLLDREARGTPAAQSLLRHYNDVLDGTRPARVSRVDFQGQPRDDRLVVTGRVVMEFRGGAPAERAIAIQAEFVMREGAPVLTRLARAPE